MNRRFPHVSAPGNHVPESEAVVKRIFCLFLNKKKVLPPGVNIFFPLSSKGVPAQSSHHV